MSSRMPAAFAAVLLCVGLLAVPAVALASGSPAPRPHGHAAAQVAGVHRKLCQGSCRSVAPVRRVHVPKHLKFRRPLSLAAVSAGSWGFDMNGNGRSGTSFAAAGGADRTGQAFACEPASGQSYVAAAGSRACRIWLESQVV